MANPIHREGVKHEKQTHTAARSRASACGRHDASNSGALPALAEEYDASPETIQSTPETAVEEIPQEPSSDPAPAQEEPEAEVLLLEADEAAPAADAAGSSSGASINFAGITDLNADLHGWSVSAGGGTAELVEDDGAQVLKLARTSDGGETALVCDSLNIKEADTRYVTVTAEMKLARDGYAHQFSLPYLFNSSNAVAYSLFTNESATKYQSHVNGKNTTDAALLTTDTWQTVRMDIDIGRILGERLLGVVIAFCRSCRYAL